MKIKLSPTRMDAPLSLRRDDDALIINDTRQDLATYQAGDSDWIIGQPAQIDVKWQVAVVFPHGSDATNTLLFPMPIVARRNGPIKTSPARGTETKTA